MTLRMVLIAVFVTVFLVYEGWNVVFSHEVVLSRCTAFMLGVSNRSLIGQ